MKFSRHRTIVCLAVLALLVASCATTTAGKTYQSIATCNATEQSLVRAACWPRGLCGEFSTLPNRWVYDITMPLLHRLWRKIPRDPRGPIDREIHVNEQALPQLHRALNHSGLNHHLLLF